MKLSRILLFASLLVLLGCGAGRKRLDARTRALLAAADKVEVYRIDGKDGPFGRESGTPAEGECIGGYRVTARGKDQGREFAARLAALLDDDKTYTDERNKCFWPGVAFRITKGRGRRSC